MTTATINSALDELREAINRNAAYMTHGVAEYLKEKVQAANETVYLHDATASRILITVEGGVIQNIDNIPDGTVIEVRDFDRDGDREHPTWSEEHQAFVGIWEGEQTSN